MLSTMTAFFLLILKIQNTIFMLKQIMYFNGENTTLRNKISNTNSFGRGKMFGLELNKGTDG